MSKRVRPAAGYFEQLENVVLPRQLKVKPKREILDGEYFVEKLLAKRKRGERAEYLVKWIDWKAEYSTWEPLMHLPPVSVNEFEQPSPIEERLEETRERLALVLERGLKSALLSSEVIDIQHDVVRGLFPKMPSVVSKKPYLVSEKEVVDAGLASFLERTVTQVGIRRRVQFPFKLQLIINFSPKFFPEQESDVWIRRPIQRLRITFLKEHK